MLRNGIFDVLNIKENTSPVNAENIYRMDSDLWRFDLGSLMVPVHLSVFLRQSQTIYISLIKKFYQLEQYPSIPHIHTAKFLAHLQLKKLDHRFNCGTRP
jgi:hypothetical protein